MTRWYTYTVNFYTKAYTWHIKHYIFKALLNSIVLGLEHRLYRLVTSLYNLWLECDSTVHIYACIYIHLYTGMVSFMRRAIKRRAVWQALLRPRWKELTCLLTNLILMAVMVTSMIPYLLCMIQQTMLYLHKYVLCKCVYCEIPMYGHL